MPAAPPAALPLTRSMLEAVSYDYYSLSYSYGAAQIQSRPSAHYSYSYGALAREAARSAAEEAAAATAADDDAYGGNRTKACVDTAFGATDGGEAETEAGPSGCDEYDALLTDNALLRACGAHDDADFSALAMCCACGGGRLVARNDSNATWWWPDDDGSGALAEDQVRPRADSNDERTPQRRSGGRWSCGGTGDREPDETTRRSREESLERLHWMGTAGRVGARAVWRSQFDRPTGRFRSGSRAATPRRRRLSRLTLRSDVAPSPTAPPLSVRRRPRADERRPAVSLCFSRARRRRFEPLDHRRHPRSARLDLHQLWQQHPVPRAPPARGEGACGARRRARREQRRGRRGEARGDGPPAGE